MNRGVRDGDYVKVTLKGTRLGDDLVAWDENSMGGCGEGIVNKKRKM